MKLELNGKKENGMQQLLSSFQEIWGLSKEESLTLFSNVCFHSEVMESVYDWAWYEVAGKLPEDIVEISPAQKILLEEAQKEIDRGKLRVKTLMSEIRDYEKTVSRLRAEVKSLKMELKQKDGE
jgi:peptidoglycan hydrolase CwlO-like protein